MKHVIQSALGWVILGAHLLLYQTAFPLIVGSNSVLSREAHVTFPAEDGNNEIRGFAAMENGFALENSTTTCLFNDFFPVSGEIVLNSGTLTLSRDLVLSNVTTWTSLGNVTGNSYNIYLSNGLSSLGSAALEGNFSFDTVSLSLNSNITLHSSILFQGSCTLNGRGNVLDLSDSGKIIIGDSGSLLIKDVTLQGISDGKIYCADSLGTITFEDVIWIQDSNYSFTQGKFEVIENFLMKGPTTIFAYQSDQQSSIGAYSMIKFDSGMTFSYDPPTASNDLLAFVNSTAVMHLEDTTLHSTTTGLHLTKGTLEVNGDCFISSDATVEGEGIMIGDGVLAVNDVDIKYFAESSLKVVSGYLVYNNIDPA